MKLSVAAVTNQIFLIFLIDIVQSTQHAPVLVFVIPDFGVVPRFDLGTVVMYPRLEKALKMFVQLVGVLPELGIGRIEGLAV